MHYFSKCSPTASSKFCFLSRAGRLWRFQQHAHRLQQCSQSTGRERVVSCRALFNFGKAAKKYASDNGREDYKDADVEDYFNYMGMLAAEGNYDRLEKMLQSGTPPVDLLLLMAASENDAPKVAELLRAGANLEAKDLDGKGADELTASEAVSELLADREKAFSF